MRRHPVPLVFLLAILLLPATGYAQGAGDSTPILNKKHTQHLLDSLKDGIITPEEAKPIPQFQIWARRFTNIICELTLQGTIICREELDLFCPSSIDVELPNGTTQTLELECGPPNYSTGKCECDFVEEEQ